MSAVPTIRFKGFQENWKRYVLGTIATFSKGKGISKSDIALNGTTPCIRYGELYTEYGEVIDSIVSSTNVPQQELKLSEGNEVIIPASGEVAWDIATASCVLREGIALGGDLNILRTKQDGRFIAFLIGGKLKPDVARLAQGNSVVHVYGDQLSTVQTTLPSLPEQKKIADFLGAVDEKIAGLRERERLLTQYKKGVMQKIFAQDIRFRTDDGSDFPDWKRSELGGICKITTGRLDANAAVEGGQFPFYTCAKDVFEIDTAAFDTEALLISGNGANVGYIHYCNGKFNAYQRTYVLDRFDANIFFIEQFLIKHLKRRIYSEAKEGNTPYIVMGTLTELQVQLPHPDEQKRIADFLSAIDDKITAVSAQISHMQDFKKGLLQQMFV